MDKEAIERFNAFPLTDIDRQILSMTDEEYHLTQWDELSEIICISYFFTSFPPAHF